MEMSPAYMAETAEVLSKKGYTITITELDERVEEQTVYVGQRYTLHADGEHIEMEALTYTDGSHAYYIKLVDFHGMESFSYPLDSWKWRDHLVEFKLVADPATATGLALRVSLPRGEPPDDPE